MKIKETYKFIELQDDIQEMLIEEYTDQELQAPNLYYNIQRGLEYDLPYVNIEIDIIKTIMESDIEIKDYVKTALKITDKEELEEIVNTIESNIIDYTDYENVKSIVAENIGNDFKTLYTKEGERLYEFAELEIDVQDRLIEEGMEDYYENTNIVEEIEWSIRYDIPNEIDIDSDTIEAFIDGDIDVEDYVRDKLKDIDDEVIENTINIIERSIHEFASPYAIEDYISEILYYNNYNLYNKYGEIKVYG